MNISEEIFNRFCSPSFKKENLNEVVRKNLDEYFLLGSAHFEGTFFKKFERERKKSHSREWRKNNDLKKRNNFY